MYRNGIKDYNCLGNVINQQTKSLHPKQDDLLLLPPKCGWDDVLVGETLVQACQYSLLCGGTCSLTRLKEVISEISHLSKTILFML